MTTTPAMPEHTIGKHDHPEPHTMCWSDLELAAIKRYAESYALAALQSQPAAAGVSDAEWWHDVLGSAGPDLLNLAKQWSDNKVHVYQFANEAEKIVKAAAQRAILALRPLASAPAAEQAEPVGRAVEVAGEIRLIPYDEAPATSPLSDGSEVFCAPLNLNCKSVQKRLMAQWGYEVQPAREPMTDEQRRTLVGNYFADAWAKRAAHLLLSDYDKHHGITAQGAQGEQA